MSEPCLKILGVYRPQISPETWHEQWQVTEDDELTREHFEKLVLIEAVVSDLDGRFKMSTFGQMMIGHPKWAENMQVGYNERLLSLDGKTLIQRGTGCIHGSGPLRFAVYLHYYDPQRPLTWQNGEIQCPPIQDVPVRLMMLMPYNACT